MDKRACVVHLFYMRVHAWFDAMSVFTFVCAVHTCVACMCHLSCG